MASLLKFIDYFFFHHEFVFHHFDQSPERFIDAISYLLATCLIAGARRLGCAKIYGKSLTMKFFHNFDQSPEGFIDVISYLQLA